MGAEYFMGRYKIQKQRKTQQNATKIYKWFK